LEDVEEMIEGILASKGEGVGLGCKEWMRVWKKVERVMRLQWHWREA
jgi:hypothetical protein